MTDTIKDAEKNHWVYHAPKSLRPYLQLARYDRPVGYWLLALPGWIGLAFASLSHGFASSDLKWAALILIGAVAMRGAGCTFNDIIDRDLDAKVERTALRPIPAGTVSLKQAWMWLGLQCAIGFIILLCLPRLAQIISLCSIPLVAAYPFMKRITWWPQVWLGMTFNWAVLVAYAAKTGTISPAVCVLYAGLIFWTIGYDTIYACQDIEDDMKVGNKSTAIRFGKRIKLGVGLSYFICLSLLSYAFYTSGSFASFDCGDFIYRHWTWGEKPARPFDVKWILQLSLFVMPLFALDLLVQTIVFDPKNAKSSLKTFKSNVIAGLILTFSFLPFSYLAPGGDSDFNPCDGFQSEISEKLYTPITPS